MKALRKGLMCFLSVVMIFESTWISALAEETEAIIESIEEESAENLDKENANVLLTESSDMLSGEESNEDDPDIEEKLSNGNNIADGKKEEIYQKTISNNMVMATESASIITSGTCGDNVTYVLDNTGLLTISGTGKMTSYSSTSMPWYEYRDQITAVIIKSGVSSIGGRSFYDFDSLNSLLIEEGLETIESKAFYDCDGLTDVTIPGSVTDFGREAFSATPWYNTLGNLVVINGILIEGRGSLYNVTIPEGVRHIADRAFYEYHSISSINFPEGLISIGDYAFYNCKNIKNLILPEGLVSIGSSAFSECYGLTSLVLPDSLRSIGNTAFAACYNLGTLIFPRNVESIGSSLFTGGGPDCISFLGDAPSFDATAFSNYSAIAYYPSDNPTWTSEILQNYGGTITWVAKDFNPDNPIIDSGSCGDDLSWKLFYNGDLVISGTGAMIDYSFDNKAPWHSGKDRIKRVVVEEGATSIGDYAFYQLDHMNSVELPDGLTGIGANSFCNCSMLQSVNIPETVSELGRSAFCSCGSLENINIPDGVVILEKNLFSGCSSLASINIPDSITKIGDFVFNECDSLKSVSIPAAVSYIGTDAFYSCGNLEEITVDLENDDYWSDNGVLFSGDKKVLFVYPAGKKDINYTIPEEVNTIISYAFSGCNFLESLTIPATITNMERLAFCGCTSLKSVVLEEGITTIEQEAFEKCTNLVSVDIPFSLTNIDYDAFNGCTNLAEIVIPPGITKIGSYAFYDCKSLAEVYYYGTESDWGKITIGSLNGNLINATRHYMIPVSIEAENCTVTVHTKNGKLIEDGEYVESGTELYISVVPNDGYVVIDQTESPITVSSNSSVKIEALADIGEIASGQCGDNCFWSLNSQGILTISGTGSIDQYFSGNMTPWAEYNDKIFKVIVESGITSISHYTFENETNLNSVILPNTLTSLACNAFNDCHSLEEIILPASIETFVFQNYCFNRCYALKDIYYLGTQTEWEQIEYYEACRSNDSEFDIHFLSLHEGHAATCTEAGVEAYYAFDGTGNNTIYSSEKTEILEIPTIAALGHDLTHVDSIPAKPGKDGNVEHYHCNRCGKNFADEEGIEELSNVIISIPAAQIVAASVYFKGKIGLNYYIDIPEEFLTDNDTFVEYVIAKLTPETGRIRISNLPTATAQGRECRKLTVDTVVKSIDDQITLHIYDGDGNKLGLLSPGGEDITEAGFVYSVGGYCDDIEAQSTNANMKDLAYKLKQYGLYVKKYLDYKADEAQPTLDVSGVTAEMLEPYKGYRTSPIVGMNFYGVSFLFKEESAVRFRFKLSSGHSIDEYAFSVDGTAVTPVLSGSQYVIEIGNIRVRDLGKEFAVEVTDQAGNTQTLSYSGLSYAKALIEQGSTEEARNAAKALYLYYVAAITYFGS